MPIFIIGTQRSGTNLLRLIVNQHPEIAAPHPPHIIQRFMPIIPLYGDLGQDHVFGQLIEDVCGLVELNVLKWHDVHLDRKEVKKRCPDQTLMAVYAAVHDLYKDSQNATTWCCKSSGNIYYLDAIESYFKDAKYLYIYRDGRDVAVSFQKAHIGEKHYYNLAQQWNKEQDLIHALFIQIGPQKGLGISYENLTKDPETHIKKICQFLEVDYVSEMLNFHQTSEAQDATKLGKLWTKLGEPIFSGNSGKYLTYADPADILLFESIAGNNLSRLGYDLHNAPDRFIAQFSEQEIAQFNQENLERKMAIRHQAHHMKMAKPHIMQRKFVEDIEKRLSQIN